MFFIKFRAGSSAKDKLMPINAFTRNDAVHLAREIYGYAVDSIVSENETLSGFEVLPFGSTVYYTELDRESGTPKHRLVYPVTETSTDPVTSTLEWFKASNTGNTNKSISVQIGCHIEEFREMLLALSKIEPEIKTYYDNLLPLENHFKDVSNTIDFLGSDEDTKTELLDSLADQIVTSLGIGSRLNFKMYEALQEVARSNWSKFEDNKPVFDSQGKLKKGRNYTKPKLKPYI